MKLFFVLSIIISCCHTIFGQQADSLIQLSQLDYTGSLWYGSNNAAALGVSQLPIHTQIKLGYSILEGNFRLPQTPQSASFLAFYTQGYRKLGAWHLHTMLDYKRHADKNQQWANNAFPTNGNPFVWADNRGGDWSRNHVNTKLNIASPFVRKKLAVGLAVDYSIGNGGRRNDPRPFYFFRQLELRPSLLYKINHKHSLGLETIYTNEIEQNEVSSGSLDAAFLYNIIGLGNFSRPTAIFANIDRQILGNTKGLKLDYSIELDSSRQWLFSAHGCQQNQDIKELVFLADGSQSYQPRGIYKNLIANGQASFLHKTKIGFYKIGSNIMIQNGSASRPGLSGIYYSDQNIQAGLNAQYANLAHLWNYQIGLDASYLSHNPKDLQQNISYTTRALASGLELWLRRNLSEKYAFWARPQLAFQYNLSSKYQSEQTNLIIEKVVLPEFDYRQAGYSMAKLGLGIDCKIAKYILQTSVALSHQNATDKALGSRNGLSADFKFWY